MKTKASETVKRKSKKRFYQENVIKSEGDAKKTWCIMKELVDKAKINKFFLPSKIVTDETEILRETNTANEFNNFFSFLFFFSIRVFFHGH